MFLILLRLSRGKSRAGEFVDAHREWLRGGFDAGVFLLAGSLRPELGGFVIANATTREELEARVLADPFVAHEVVEAELFELSPSKAHPRLQFLLA